ncbi:MAG: cell division topological specificity factor MinE [Geminocystis sp.]|nr:cell division topological specificity factor MinE [Geminocystis sp.]MCX8079038.1 cell division topological specificity factor MinE [Geminocystis sp.]HIK38531.1 cell division topological specificity factor MinE [Geminocystis sp. M7585_C2015_104]
MFKGMIGEFNPWGGSSSRIKAKNRLELVLSCDRAGINPEAVNRMRDEIVEVVSRYLDIDLEKMEFCIKSNDRNTSLSAILPIRKFKRVFSASPPDSQSVEEEKHN